MDANEPKPTKWFNIWAFPSWEYLGQMTATDSTECYDPRIKGDGSIVVQEASEGTHPDFV